MRARRVVGLLAVAGAFGACAAFESDFTVGESADGGATEGGDGSSGGSTGSSSGLSSGSTTSSTSGSSSGSGSGSASSSSSTGGGDAGDAGSSTSSASSSGATSSSSTSSSGTTTSSGSSSSSSSSSSGGPASTGLSVEYQVGAAAGSSAFIGCTLDVLNATGTSIPLSALEVRYYYLSQGFGTPTMSIFWAYLVTPGSQTAITANSTFGAITPAVPEADSYVSFTFSGGLNVASGDSVKFMWQFASPNTSADDYTQTNDYSFNASDTTLTAWSHVLLLVNGSIAWGTPP